MTHKVDDTSHGIGDKSTLETTELTEVLANKEIVA